MKIDKEDIKNINLENINITYYTTHFMFDDRQVLHYYANDVKDGYVECLHFTSEKIYKRGNLVKNKEVGIWEYYNPKTGEGLASSELSWTAALTLDLLKLQNLNYIFTKIKAAYVYTLF